MMYYMSELHNRTKLKITNKQIWGCLSLGGKPSKLYTEEEPFFFILSHFPSKKYI